VKRRIIVTPGQEPYVVQPNKKSMPENIQRTPQTPEQKQAVRSQAVADVEPDRSNQPREGEMFGTEFLDNIAHQMVAPLQSIELNCNNILNGNVPQDKIELRLREVIGHANILVELARRMRFLHELVTGKVVNTERLEFPQVVSSWIAGFNNYLSAIEATGMSADIKHEEMNRLPDIVGSKLAVQQVIMNLYDNAIKYGMQKSCIHVSARQEKGMIINEFSHSARVILTQKAANHVGERGFRAEEARKLRAAGTGIGMWVVRKLMTAMQGSFQAIPTDSSGITRFRLFWRIAS